MTLANENHLYHRFDRKHYRTVRLLPARRKIQKALQTRYRNQCVFLFRCIRRRHDHAAGRAGRTGS